MPASEPLPGPPAKRLPNAPKAPASWDLARAPPPKRPPQTAAETSQPIQREPLHPENQAGIPDAPPNQRPAHPESLPTPPQPAPHAEPDTNGSSIESEPQSVPNPPARPNPPCSTPGRLQTRSAPHIPRSAPTAPPRAWRPPTSQSHPDGSAPESRHRQKKSEPQGPDPPIPWSRSIRSQTCHDAFSGSPKSGSSRLARCNKCSRCSSRRSPRPHSRPAHGQCPPHQTHSRSPQSASRAGPIKCDSEGLFCRNRENRSGPSRGWEDSRAWNHFTVSAIHLH